MTEGSPSGRITITDKEQKDNMVKQLEQRLEGLAQSELERETEMGTGQAVQPASENIYTKQIGQFINAVDEISSHIEAIGHKASIILEEQPPAEERPPLEPSRTSTTVLSGSLAELASHIAVLGNKVIDLENRIIS